MGSSSASVQGIALLPVTGKLGSEELGRRGLNVASMEHLQGVQVGRGNSWKFQYGFRSPCFGSLFWRSKTQVDGGFGHDPNSSDIAGIEGS